MPQCLLKYFSPVILSRNQIEEVMDLSFLRVLQSMKDSISALIKFLYIMSQCLLKYFCADILSRNQIKEAMDLSFLRTLQYMEDIGENPPFKPEDIDLATFTTTYPDVIIVDQKLVDGVDLDTALDDKGSYFRLVEEKEFLVNHGPSNQAGPGLEIHTNSIARALEKVVHMRVESRSDEKPWTPCWTVILKEGLYIDPSFLVWSPPQSKLDYVAVEIVGMKGARILFVEKKWKVSDVTGFQNATVTLRNVIIHDRRGDRPLDGSTYASPNQVAFNGLQCTYDAKLTLKNCLLSGCVLRLESGSIVTAVDTHFIVCPMILLHHSSRALIQNCFIDCRLDIHLDGTGNFPFFNVYPGASLVCRKSEIRGYGKVVDAEGTGTEVSLEENRFFVWDCVGKIKENASVKVHRNYIHSPFLLIIMLNVSGKIDFKENRLEKVCGCTRSVFYIDKHSVKPTTDIAGVAFGRAEFNAADYKEKTKQSSAFRKSFNKSYHRQQIAKQANGETPDTSPALWKRCQGCFMPEVEEVIHRQSVQGASAVPFNRFRYCARCRVVCYCSQECQMKHWPDHKLTCAMFCAVDDVERNEESEDKENLAGASQRNEVRFGDNSTKVGQGKETKTKVQRGKDARKGKKGQKRK